MNIAVSVCIIIVILWLVLEASGGHGCLSVLITRAVFVVTYQILRSRLKAAFRSFVVSLRAGVGVRMIIWLFENHADAPVVPIYLQKTFSGALVRDFSLNFYKLDVLHAGAPQVLRRSPVAVLVEVVTLML